MTSCFVLIFTGAFIPIYVGIQTSFSHYVNDGHMRQYFEVEFEFNQFSHSSHHDENQIEGKLGYVGKIQEIMQVKFSSF